MNITLAGENSIIVYFGDKIDPDLPNKIARVIEYLNTQLADLIIDLTPAYTSLLISYDLNLIAHQQFCQRLEHCLRNIDDYHHNIPSRLIDIPAYYDSEVGFDLTRLLSEKQLNLDDFIQLHTEPEYQVYAIGFSPVFAFLGKVDERIQSPRLATPRIKIPAGSIGIADSQTAIYPTPSSGGWNIIARTPFDLSLNNPINIDRFKIGDRVKFHAISRHEFQSY